jgi:hypothetical protein
LGTVDANLKALLECKSFSKSDQKLNWNHRAQRRTQLSSSVSVAMNLLASEPMENFFYQPERLSHRNYPTFWTAPVI